MALSNLACSKTDCSITLEIYNGLFVPSSGHTYEKSLEYQNYEVYMVWSQHCYSTPNYVLPLLKSKTIHPTPRNALSVCSFVTFFTPSACAVDQPLCISEQALTGAWVTRPERPKGVKDVIKQAQRAPRLLVSYIYPNTLIFSKKHFDFTNLNLGPRKICGLRFLKVSVEGVTIAFRDHWDGKAREEIVLMSWKWVSTTGK